MSVFEIAIWLGIIVVLVAAGARLRSRTRLAERHIRELRQQLLVFSEASTAVAQAVTTSMLHPATYAATEPAAQSREASRRYILRQARAAVLNGQSTDQVSVELGLSSDEARLLTLVSDLSKASDNTQVAGCH